MLRPFTKSSTEIEMKDPSQRAQQRLIYENSFADFQGFINITNKTYIIESNAPGLERDTVKSDQLGFLCTIAHLNLRLHLEW
jgi:hypothetical protein